MKGNRKISQKELDQKFQTSQFIPSFITEGNKYMLEDPTFEFLHGKASNTQFLQLIQDAFAEGFSSEDYFDIDAGMSVNIRVNLNKFWEDIFNAKFIYFRIKFKKVKVYMCETKINNQNIETYCMNCLGKIYFAESKYYESDTMILGRFESQWLLDQKMDLLWVKFID